MKPRAYATTPQMRETAARALAMVRKHRFASDQIDDAIMAGIADGMDVTPGDALAMHQYFETAGFLETGAAPPLSMHDLDSIVASLYGGTNGLHWCARVARQIRKDSGNGN
jgi:hypothetical protein